MSPSEPVSSIADASRPNAGRIYDYLLGGNHNFEIDRQAAQQLLKMIPELPQWARVVRWFLGEAVRRLVEQGFTYFLDFASGLPTVDHIHQLAPSGTRVIYSDIDPITVAYAQDIVRDLPNIACVECNAGEPEKLLQSDVIKKIFGKEHKVAIGYNGIAWFLPNDRIAHALEVVYAWADKGSKMFISEMDTKTETEATSSLFNYYAKIGQNVYRRSLEQSKDLLGKWKIEDPGFLPLVEWIGVDKHVLDESREKAGGMNIFGAILRK